MPITHLPLPMGRFYASVVHWDTFAATDVGRRRPRNEDAYLLLPEAGLFAVADGMGGHAAGDVASAMAIAAVAAFAGDAAVNASGLAEMVRTANRSIHNRSAAEPEKAGMGTTLTVLALAKGDNTFLLAHVGDSRAYLLRDGQLRQLTRDHTWVQMQVEAGLLSPQQARVHPRANVITRSLGVEAAVEPDLELGTLHDGDLLMLCSDGLTGMLDDSEIAGLMQVEHSLAQVAADLIDAANMRGGTDNITVVLIRAAA